MFKMEVFDAPSHYYPSDAMSLDELAYWITFNRVSGIGPVSFKSLLEYYHNNLEAAWKADTKELAQAGLTQKTIENVVNLRTTSTPQRELEKLEKLRIRVITWKDKNYPPLLREIDDSPPVLYTYGRQVTERIVTELAKGQVTIVSGLALGIDTIAHTAALDAGGRTIAVLASGLDIIYPPTNRGLARRIVESGQGVLITEYPLGVQPDGGNFPARNRIISGLSLGVLVAEAPLKSGALITAGFALKQGRDVFGIPGSILSNKSSGVNKLIQDGAKPVMEVNDILEALNLFMIPQHVEMQAVLPDNDDERVLLKLISHEPCHVDDLIRGSELATTTVSSTLMMMELKGMIKQVGGMQYVLAR